MTEEIQTVTLIDISSYPVSGVLKTLLLDRATEENIVFATEVYETEPTAEITLEWLASHADDIQPRVSKSVQTQQERTRKAGEVFTPSWICNKMNNYCDAEWFGRKNVFNTETEQNWRVNPSPVKFDETDGWEKYIDSPRLEITCGEAPYIASRYDTTTGEIIEIKRRIGILDRKMRVVNENTDNETDWLKWTERAFQSVYGYEFQGDNLLIARINLLGSFVDYLQDRWGRKAKKSELQKFAEIISWNFWQMDGITGTIPFGKPVEECQQLSLFDFVVDEEPKAEETNTRPAVDCKIYDWRNKQQITYKSLKKGA